MEASTFLETWKWKSTAVNRKHGLQSEERLGGAKQPTTERRAASLGRKRWIRLDRSLSRVAGNQSINSDQGTDGRPQVTTLTYLHTYNRHSVTYFLTSPVYFVSFVLHCILQSTVINAFDPDHSLLARPPPPSPVARHTARPVTRLTPTHPYESIIESAIWTPHLHTPSLWQLRATMPVCGSRLWARSSMRKQSPSTLAP
jgi:hypothetical protein